MAEVLALKKEMVALARDVMAISVPDGNIITLQMDDEVNVVHELGGDFAVRTMDGSLFQIQGINADALGREIPNTPVAERLRLSGAELSEDVVWEQLANCFDPEIPVNIVELGLIYGCEIGDAEGGGREVKVRMTLTAPGCGMADVLVDDVRRKVSQLPTVEGVTVDITFDPPWTPERMSEAARLQVGFM